MMRALVLSDIHGEESQLRWMLEETWKMTGKIDGYFFLGDGVDDFAQAENFIRRRDPDEADRALQTHLNSVSATWHAFGQHSKAKK